MALEGESASPKTPQLSWRERKRAQREAARQQTEAGKPLAAPQHGTHAAITKLLCLTLAGGAPGVAHAEESDHEDHGDAIETIALELRPGFHLHMGHTADLHANGHVKFPVESSLPYVPPHYGGDAYLTFHLGRHLELGGRMALDYGRLDDGRPSLLAAGGPQVVLKIFPAEETSIVFSGSATFGRGPGKPGFRTGEAQIDVWLDRLLVRARYNAERFEHSEGCMTPQLGWRLFDGIALNAVAGGSFCAEGNNPFGPVTEFVATADLELDFHLGSHGHGHEDAH